MAAMAGMVAMLSDAVDKLNEARGKYQTYKHVVATYAQQLNQMVNQPQYAAAYASCYQKYTEAKQKENKWRDKLKRAEKNMELVRQGRMPQGGPIPGAAPAAGPARQRAPAAPAAPEEDENPAALVRHIMGCCSTHDVKVAW